MKGPFKGDKLDIQIFFNKGVEFLAIAFADIADTFFTYQGFPAAKGEFFSFGDYDHCRLREVRHGVVHIGSTGVIFICCDDHVHVTTFALILHLLPISFNPDVIIKIQFRQDRLGNVRANADELVILLPHYRRSLGVP